MCVLIIISLCHFFLTIHAKDLPLKYVIDELKLEGLPSEVSEVAVAKALRLHAAETLEIRMVFSAPTWSNWSGKDASKTDPGMYEIRRKSPGIEDHQYSRAYWEERTLYMVNSPPSPLLCRWC